MMVINNVIKPPMFTAQTETHSKSHSDHQTGAADWSWRCEHWGGQWSVQGRVQHLPCNEVLLGDQVCWRGVHQWQRGLRPRGDQDVRPQQGGHAPGHPGSGPQVPGGEWLLSMCLQRFWNIFTKNLISSDRQQYFYPNVISSFLKLLNARKSFNYYSWKTETKMFILASNNYRSLRDILSFPE